MDPKVWVRTECRTLADRHFSGRSAEVERLVRELSEHHAWVWRRTAAPNYRPTAAMYALALRWELERRGSVCAFCDHPVALATDPGSASDSPGPLTLGPRVPPTKGGLNVPQNIALGHDDCLPAW